MSGNIGHAGENEESTSSLVCGVTSAIRGGKAGSTRRGDSAYLGPGPR